MMETAPQKNATLTDDLGTSTTQRREHFIPVRKADLVAALARDDALDQGDSAKFQSLCQILSATIHFQYHETLESLKSAYDQFDPDRDTINLSNAGDGETKSLFDQFAALLDRANYQHLSKAEIERALTATGDWGLNIVIDFDVFSRLEVFARGLRQETSERRRWQRLFLKETVSNEVYQRLVIIFRLNDHPRVPAGIDPQTVYIKIFKDIPRHDLDTLLPGTRVKMTLIDQSKIILPTLSGIGMAISKIVAAAAAATMNVFALLAAIGATVGYGIKSFFGFLRTKEKHQHNLTKNLYFQNLDNNAGVVFRILDEAEDQEFREAILAYFLLWKRAPAGGWTMQQVDEVAEEYLREEFGVDADFEIDDAVDKLHRFRMIESVGENLSAVPIDQALESLDEAWDNFFPFYQG